MPLIRLRDLLDFFTIATLLPFAWFLPQTSWPKFCNTLGRLHVALLKHRNSRLDKLLLSQGLDLDSKELEVRFRTENYYELLYTLREYKGVSQDTNIILTGEHHLKEALEQGSGAVLWLASLVHSELIIHKCLYWADLPAHFLSSREHGFQSPTKFGQSFLNPIKSRMETRYLSERHVMSEGKVGEAIRAMIDQLHDNGIISIMAVNTGRRVGKTELLGGSLCLAKGAPNIAITNHAPLLPLFAVRKNNGNFEVNIKPPLKIISSDVEKAEQEMIDQFGNYLEDYLKEYPEHWRGWFGQGTLWHPKA